jgi:hypothetical protein
MARLEALLLLLGGAAVVMRLHWGHVCAAACFEAKRYRRHFEYRLSGTLRWVWWGRAPDGDNFVIVWLIENNFGSGSSAVASSPTSLQLLRHQPPRRRHIWPGHAQLARKVTDLYALAIRDLKKAFY